MPPDQQPQAPSTAGQPSWMAPVQPVVPDHELLRRIGGGSYGDVWLARNVVGTWRAVKVVFRDRFTDARPYEREFNGMLTFEPLSRSNEAFIDILQIGRNDSEGYFYYVMELADDAPAAGGSIQSSVISKQSGGPEARQPLTTDNCSLITGLDPSTYVPLTLSKALLQRGRLPVNDCLELGLTLNLGLAHLHRAGLIHRDIKPSNIIFVGGVPKLADIGLVIETSEARSYVGTEGFIPPEGPNSPQADLYSLGKVLYEAGMGKDRKDFPEPFTQLAEAPDSAQLLEFNAILLKACAANVTERYQSAGEMNADLALLQGGGSVRNQRTLTRRLRLVQRVAFGILTLAVLIGMGWLWQARQTRVMRNLAEAKAHLADANRERVLQLKTAHGIEQMNAGDIGEAMLWFAEALPYVTNDAARADMHRFRLTNLLLNNPLPVAHIIGPRDETVRGGNEGGGVGGFEISQNGQRMILPNANGFEIWELSVPPRQLAVLPYHSASRHDASISADGRRILLNDRRHPPRLWKVDQDGRTNMVTLGADIVLRIEFSADEHEYQAFFMTNYLARIQEGSVEPARRVQFPDLEEEMDWGISRDAALMANRYPTNGVTRLIETSTGRMVSEFALPVEWSRPLPVANGRLLLAWSPQPQDFTQKPRRYRAQLFDIKTGRAVGNTIAHGDVILVNGINHERTMMVTGSGDETARVWSLETGDPLSPPLRHSSRVVAVAGSDDGTRVATGDLGGLVRIWDIRTGRQLTQPLPHGKNQATILRFAQGDSMLVSMDSEGLIRLWDLARPELNSSMLEVPSLTAGSIAISPDGNMLAAGARGKIFVWNTHDWQRLISLPLPSDEKVYSVTFASTGPYLIFQQGKDKVRVVNTTTWQSIGQPFTHGTNRIEYALSPNGQYLATAGEDGLIRIWNWLEGTEAYPALHQPSGERADVVWSPGGDRILTIVAAKDRPRRGQLWEPATGIKIGGEFLFSSTPARPLGKDFCFGPGGGQWAFNRPDGIVQVKSDSGRDISFSPMKQAWNQISDLTFSPDGTQLAICTPLGQVAVHDVASGLQSVPLISQSGYGLRTQFSADGRKLAFWSQYEAKLWDSRTGEALCPSIQGTPYINGTAMHPEGRFLVAMLPNEGIRMQQFPESLMEAEMLAEFTGFVTGKQIGDGSRPGFIPQSQWIDLAGKLRAQRPELFARSPKLLARWHDQKAGNDRSVVQIRQSLFHLDRLIELSPADPSLLERRTVMATRRVPDRSPNTPPRLVDLSEHYTDSFATLDEGGLAGLPRGVHLLGGTEFDLRGAIVLRHPPQTLQRNQEKGRISYIRVAQRCAELHFLHGLISGDIAADTEVAHWNIHYVDGSQRPWSVRYGVHLRELSSRDKCSQAEVAWEGGAKQPKNGGPVRRLYQATWVNPTPDVEISHLEFEAGERSRDPFVVAITAR